jgi:glutamate dehydrogenase
MINRMGLIHPFELAEEEGTSVEHVAEAFVTASELLGMGALWAAIDGSEMPEAARLALFEQAALGLRSHMADLLRTAGQALEPSRIIGEIAAGVGELIDHVDDLLAAEGRTHAAGIATALVSSGAPERLAARVANLFAIDGAIGLARLARDTRIAPVRLTEAFIALGDRLGLGWAQASAALMSPADPWERLLVAGLARDFQQMRFEFLRIHAAEGGAKSDPQAWIDAWAKANAAAIERFRAIVARAQAAGAAAPAMLAHVAGQARTLLRR